MGCTRNAMPRFFIEPGAINSNCVTITGEDYEHIKKVLRLRVGEEVWLSSRGGIDYRSVIGDYGTNCVNLEVLEEVQNKSEPSLQVTLYQGLPKSDKLELIIQKCVELGVSKIVPVITERTVVKIEGKEISKKLERWRKISLEASKQSNRGRVPLIDSPIKWKDAVSDGSNFDCSLIPYEKHQGKNLKGILKSFSGNSISIYIGPEGGFTEMEISEAKDAGIMPISLGPRILRTETAGFALLSVLMYELEGW